MKKEGMSWVISREMLNEDNFYDQATEKQILDRLWEESGIESTPDFEADDPCLTCEDFQTVWHYPMGIMFPAECLGDQCTREGGCNRG